jgi:hypothetical protein
MPSTPLKPSFKAHQNHVEHIIDVLVAIITLYPDNLITFSLNERDGSIRVA